ncbi:hypothetical protein [Streptomyces syringium]|uniref:hypothetical protein n=1 Tax=Streptomyces syringium TaxID=76729 RepID=UPI0033FCEE8A
MILGIFKRGPLRPPPGFPGPPPDPAAAGFFAFGFGGFGFGGFGHFTHGFLGLRPGFLAFLTLIFSRSFLRPAAGFPGPPPAPAAAAGFFRFAFGDFGFFSLTLGFLALRPGFPGGFFAPPPGVPAPAPEPAAPGPEPACPFLLFLLRFLAALMTGRGAGFFRRFFQRRCASSARASPRVVRPGPAAAAAAFFAFLAAVRSAFF